MTRLPWLAAGYGTDPDSHRVVVAARHLAATGTYEVSRFPGNPVHEILTVLVVRGGPLATNGLSALFSVACAWFIARMAGNAGLRWRLLPACALAMAPVFYVASVSTIDYVWALAFILAAFHLSSLRRPVFSGAMLGLAIGCRITSGMMVVPLAWLWLSNREDRLRFSGAAVFLAVAGGTGLACYLPGLFRYGPRLFSFYELGYPPLREVVVNATVGVWGTLGVVAFSIPALAISVCGRTVMACRAATARRELAAWSMAAALCLLAYLRLPHEAGYLIPLVPFVLLIVGALSPTVPAAVFYLLLTFSPFFTVGRSGVNPGQIFQDHASRQKQERMTAALIEAVQRAPMPSAIVAGEDLPVILSTRGSDREGASRYLYAIPSQDQLDALQREGWRLYVLPRALRANWKNYRVDLEAGGAIALSWEELERGRSLDSAADILADPPGLPFE